MAFPARRQCQYPRCYFGEDGQPYETQEGLVSQDSVLKDMELHLIMAHTVHGEPVSEAPSEVHPDKPLSLDIDSHLNIGFLGQLTAQVNQLSHVGINEFGRWAKIRVEDHPEVDVRIEPDVAGYDELKLQPKPPLKHKATTSRSLVDTGAQMVVMGVKTVYAMGLGKKNIIPVGMTIRAANTGGLKLLGGVLVRISGKVQDGRERFTRQLAYVAEDVDRVFLSKKACEELGIISNNFPIIGAYAMESAVDATIAADKDILPNKDSKNGIKKFKACEGL